MNDNGRAERETYKQSAWSYDHGRGIYMGGGGRQFGVDMLSMKGDASQLGKEQRCGGRHLPICCQMAAGLK